MQNALKCALLATLLWACEETVIPKPRGYYRIDFPQKQYLEYRGSCPFIFSYPFRSLLDTAMGNNQYPCWMNLHYPQYAATIHITYHDIQSADLSQYIEDARKLALKHLVRADDISEQMFRHPERAVYGVVYDLEGGSASNYQFFLTDSVSKFLRGSMYFNLPPNPDSIAPVNTYIKEDLKYFIESFRWR
ncbi:MAG: gliding motility lipoprotein GldD [Flavobacteriales bacterium]|jgi:gliding motility-associated lipoprotein GldD|nr:gliding motility lipoprotein GldD [Flavobacteriales bacterium]